MATATSRNVRRFQVLDGTTLKIIAMVSMVLDHVGDAFFPDQMWMRAIGRMAMPLFAFCVAEGYIHTRDRTRYLERMAVFALISELPFDLFASGGIDWSQQNIMCTFALAILALHLFDYFTQGRSGAPGLALGIGAVVALGLLSVPLGFNYNFSAIIVIFVFYYLRDWDQIVRTTVGTACLMLFRNVGIYAWGILSFVPLALYNGRRGRGLKLFFYVFYPAHMLVLYALKVLLG